MIVKEASDEDKKKHIIAYVFPFDGDRSCSIVVGTDFVDIVGSGMFDPESAKLFANAVTRAADMVIYYKCTGKVMMI